MNSECECQVAHFWSAELALLDAQNVNIKSRMVNGKWEQELATPYPRGLISTPSLPLWDRMKVVWPTVVSPGAALTADDDASTDKGEKNVTVGVQAVTQQFETSSSERMKGLSSGTSVHQGKVGQWTSGVEEELKQLATLHADPKRKVAWAKVVVAWTQIMPLDAANEQDNTVLAVAIGVGVHQHRKTGNDNSQEIICDPLLIINCDRKIGCEVYHKPTRRTIPNFDTQSVIDKVDLIMSDQIIRKMNGEPTWSQLSILIYAGALTVEKLCKQASEDKQNRSKIWFSSTYKEVDALRQVIGKASSELNRRKVDAEVAPTA
ncbi:unnamed protein product, partial [Adineta ricciae]